MYRSAKKVLYSKVAWLGSFKYRMAIVAIKENKRPLPVCFYFFDERLRQERLQLQQLVYFLCSGDRFIYS